MFLGALSLSCAPESKTCAIVNRPILTQNLGHNSGQPLDTAILEFDNRNYLFVTYMINPKDKNLTAPVSIYSFDQNDAIKSPVENLGKTQHVRSFSKIKSPFGEGVLLADHGVDGNGYPGGKLSLFIKNFKTDLFEDFSQKVDIGLNFSFNAVAVKRKNSRFDDILVAPYNSGSSKVVYLKSDQSKYIDDSQSLPRDWKAAHVCFMTATALDLEKDGQDEIVLGGCDLEKTQAAVKSDQLMVWKENRWQFSSPETFPPRKKSASWGTVYWLKDKDRLIALTHNKGFTEADLQIFHYNSHLKKFEEEPVELKANSAEKYFHKIQKFHDDYIVLIRYGSPRNDSLNLFKMKKNSSGKWNQEEVCLASPPGEVALGIDVFKGANGKEKLAVTYYSGRLDIFE